MGRHLLAVVLIIGALLLAHLAEGVVFAGLGMGGAPDPGLIIFLIGFLMVAIGVYLGWMMRVINFGRPKWLKNTDRGV
jgi:hypothetical protein